MKKRLVIAEKQSVARAIAAAIGANEKENVYLEGNGYLVSWCIGHLVELAAPTVYDGKYAKWNVADLPILPEPWRYTISDSTKAQFNTLKRIMNDPSVDSIICATDAGREGELIFRLVYILCGCKKSVERLWISSMEETAIMDGFQNLKPASQYDSLYESALCRAQADWLVGINATRLFSTMYNKTLNIGRVMTPTLAMLVRREAQIATFKPVPFYNVQLDCAGLVVQSERLQEYQDAERIASMCDRKDAKIVSLENKARLDNPPSLYDLTSLQRDANRLLGYTAQQTLDYTQALYEKKLCTYPRTDSRFLTSHMEAGISSLAEKVFETLPFTVSGSLSCNPLRVIDNTKVSDHHAILPTVGVAGLEQSALPLGERSILNLLMVRLLCAVGEACRLEESTLNVECEGQLFTAKGTCVMSQGWKALETAFHSSLKDKPVKQEQQRLSLPRLNEGAIFPAVNASVKEGQTSAPKRFTEDTLLAAMETAGIEDMPEDTERKGLGTPATRAGILEKLVNVGFMERKKLEKTTVLMPTLKGSSLVVVLPEELLSPLLTAQWEQKLMRIENGTLSSDDFLRDIRQMVASLISNSRPMKNGHSLFLDESKTIGVCPRCGNVVQQRPKSFSCTNHECQFVMWKNSRFFTSKRRELTMPIAMALLKDGRILVNGLYSEKSGKSYDATVVLLDDGQYVNYKLEFAKGREADVYTR